ncbi:MAG: trypsin-like peptidase domain-containing protein [bacterium]|nr:trypsin-like peptidase domain-containing protein [bacterium]
MQKKLAIAGIVVTLIVVVGGSVSSMNSYEEKLANQKLDFEGEVQGLREKISQLEGKIGAVGEQSQKAELSIKELQNRQVVRQKSQDELLTAAVSRVAPAVVSIVVSKDVPLLEVVYENPFGNDPFFKDFGFRIPVYRQKGVEHQRVGAGTGFLITADGYILTNKHVLEGKEASYTALLSDGKQIAATVAHRSETQDIAILKIEGGGFATVNLGNSDSLKLGQSVAAIGNALGKYSNSVSVGIISGLERKLEVSGTKFENVIQTDAAINPGNSGGPLLNLDGRVVGVNVATVIGSNSISFSIPINLVKDILREQLNRDF